MKRNCPKCSSVSYTVPEFTLDEKRLLLKIKSQNDLPQFIQTLKPFKDLTSIDVKFNWMHINVEYGKCNRCNVNYLNKEYILCPKCNALNFNWSL